MEKFRNKYRIQSHRMPGWDYSKNGIYFITLVTQNRECILGEIVDCGDARPCVSLSEFGKIVENEWLKSFEIRDEMFLEEYIIMPNHLHAIVVLDNNGIEKNETNELHGTHGLNVETHGRASLQSAPHSKTDHLSVNPNQFHHLLQDINHPQIQKLMILLMKTIWVFQNSIGTIIFFNPIITTT